MILQGTDRAKERDLILGGAWPHHPILPVERDRDGETWSQLGCIAWHYVPSDAPSDGPWTVYLGNMMEMMVTARERQPEGPLSWATVLEGAEKIVYENLDAFFDAGWRAD